MRNTTPISAMVLPPKTCRVGTTSTRVTSTCGGMVSAIPTTAATSAGLHRGCARSTAGRPRIVAAHRRVVEVGLDPAGRQHGDRTALPMQVHAQPVGERLQRGLGRRVDRAVGGRSRLPAIDPVNTMWPMLRLHHARQHRTSSTCTAARRLMSINASATAAFDCCSRAEIADDAGVVDEHVDLELARLQ